MMIEFKSAVKVFVIFDVFVIFTLFGVCGTCPGGFDSKGCVTCPKHCTFCNSSYHCYICDIGYSGKICQHHCDKCKPGTRCAKEDGFCREGCRDGRSGLYCKKTCDSRCKTCYRNDKTECLIYRNNQTSEPVSDKSSTDALMVVVPILTAVLIILLGGILFMLCWKRKQSRRCNDSHHVVDRPLHTMGRHMENQRHSVSMSWKVDVAFYDSYDHLSKTSSTTADKSETVVPEENGTYSYAVLDAGYKVTHMAEDTKQNNTEEQ